MSVTVGVGVVLVTVLLGVSAFFSSTEIAVFSLPSEKVGVGEDSEALARLRSDPHRLLVTILVGNNVVNVAVSSIVTLLVAQRLSGGAAAVVATTSASVLILILGEIIPSRTVSETPSRGRYVRRVRWSLSPSSSTPSRLSLMS
ncbi:DUF21 domain-containing protein [Haladaptatus sp. F3-133]|uniref:DUF21 domain-containing protein n=1 Tax=Halorutilus salinus TaxID=2487751 RepID=A0A9Q4GJW5_9EURY|nr:DUF21 domain-containing protein [Halorutilus salinus]